MSNGNEMDDIINDFITESEESLSSLDQKFVELEKRPGDTTLLNDIFRSAHTIKGAAGFLGFQRIVDVTHVTEDVLNKLRKGEMAVTPEVMDAILNSIDVIKVLIARLRTKDESPVETQQAVNALKAVLEGAGAQVRTVASEAPKAPEVVQATAQPVVAAQAPATAQIPVMAPTQVQQARPVEAAPVAAPVAVAEPVAAVKAEEPKAPEAAKAAGRSEEGTAAKEQSIRVDTSRVDSVMNLIGELVLSRNRLLLLGAKLGEKGGDNDLSTNINEAIAQLDLNTTDLQLAVMKIRMQPVAKVFNKFPRMVRDLARQNNKEIELVIHGEETELDKTVIEEIGDPLVHLIRNSADHGIETPEERAAKGKPRHGTITLSAYQEGRHIILSVADDGKGMDPEHIKRSAVEKGLISADDADKMSKKDALNLIFIPGFSTAKKISNISGRGVGMDVVKTNISRINGTIGIDSEIGKGSKIIFRLPLTLAIIQVLTVEGGGEIYGIPLSTVIENIRVATSEIRTVDGMDVIHLRDRVFPVVRLSDLVGKSASASKSEWKYIVITGLGEKTFGILVDRLHGQEEIVMKSMGEYLRGTDGIAGACITGDGNVILILDMAGLLAASAKRRRAYAH